MAKEPVDKHQILLKGGSIEDQDVSQSWLTFLTDPANLKPGLPNLSVACRGYYGWDKGYNVSVSFDETKASLRSIRLKVGTYENCLQVFQEIDPQIIAANSNSSYLATNPHHLKKWIFNLFLNTELEHLEINFFNTELPDLFDALPKLKTVHLSGSKLRGLPPSFFRLPELVSLDISGSEIIEVAQGIGQLQSLQNLTISQPCVPSALGKLQKLTSFISRCPEFTIPADIIQLSNLRFLTLTDVVSAPGDLLNLPNLEYLYFHATKNVVFNFTKINAPALKELNTNHPAAFARAIAHFENLEYFITGNKTLTVPEVNDLTNSISKLNTLSYVALPGLGIRDIEFCLSLPNLKWVDLSNNTISKVPLGFSSLHQLMFLDLSNNSIAHTSTELNTLYQSGLLNLKDNPLDGFPDLNIRNEAKQRIIQRGGTHALMRDSDVTFVEWLTFLTNPENLQPGLPDIIIRHYTSVINVSFDNWKPSLRSLKLELTRYELNNTNLFQQLKSLNPPLIRQWVTNLFLNTELEELQIPFQNAELPDQFNSLTNLKRVDFSHSKLIQLPKSFCQLNTLETLYLNDSLLTDLPDEINLLTNLTNIDLRRTLLTKIPAGLFSLKYLKNLYLEGTTVTEFPDRFEGLTRLKTLSLNTSKLTQLPLSLFQLSALENLSLDGTSLTQLPDRFDSLANLKSVSINISTLTQLPPSFFQLSALENLNLDGTSISQFPDHFNTLMNLKNVSLRIAPLNQLPLSFFQLSAVEELNLEGTAIAELPDRFDSLISLKKISLNKLKLTLLPSSFFLLPTLEWLDLTNSSLPEIQAELGKLHTLRYLAFSQPCNPAAWAGLTELTELYCDCPDFCVPTEFSKLVRLKTLSLKSVSFAAYESMNLPELEILEFKIDRSSYRPFNLEANLPKLKELRTNYIETFYQSLRTGVLKQKRVTIIT